MKTLEKTFGLAKFSLKTGGGFGVRRGKPVFSLGFEGAGVLGSGRVVGPGDGVVIGFGSVPRWLDRWWSIVTVSSRSSATPIRGGPRVRAAMQGDYHFASDKRATS